MCIVMVIDNNQMRRNWLKESIQNSNIKVRKIILCKTNEEAEHYIEKGNIDIALTRIEKEDTSRLKLIKTMHKKLLFSIVLGYGRCKDVDFLCNIVNEGVSQYLQDIFDKNKLNTFLNDAYEKYCILKLKLKLIAEKSREKTKSSYNGLMLKQFVDNYVRNIKSGYESRIQGYIDILLDMMDNQQLYQSKSMILELMMIMTNQIEKGLINTDYVIFNSKDYCRIMNAKDAEQMKKMVAEFLLNLAKNIQMLLNHKDCKSRSICAAINYINKNYDKNISRDDVAAAVYLNPSYFSKFFKEQTGESFVSYLRRIRLEKAKIILEETGTSVKNISKKVGYSDSKYFAKLFYDYSGYTPCKYRESLNKFVT